MTKRRKLIQMLCEGALMIAISLILGQLTLYRLPQGGSISLEMLPLFLFCVRWGMGGGFIACFASGILQMFIEGAVAWGWASMLLDFIVAFGVIGIAGLGKDRKGGIFWGSVIGAVARFIIHFISGITIYKIVAPTELFGTVFDNAWLYSAVYNGSYVAIDLIACLVIFGILYKHKVMNKYLTGADLRRS